MKVKFYGETSLLLVETIFLAGEKPFFQFEAVKTVSPKVNAFFTEFFISASGNEFPV